MLLFPIKTVRKRVLVILSLLIAEILDFSIDKLIILSLLDFLTSLKRMVINRSLMSRLELGIRTELINLESIRIDLLKNHVMATSTGLSVCTLIGYHS
jgi:hypothetical protein